MKVFIWLACVLGYSLLVTTLQFNGIALGAIPTTIFATVAIWFLPRFLCKKWDERGEKKYQKSRKDEDKEPFWKQESTKE